MIEIVITSSLLILAILLVRTMLKGKISLRLQYALWGLVLLRLLVPSFLFSSPLSIMNLIPDIKQRLQVYGEYTVISIPVGTSTSVMTTELTTDSHETSSNSGIDTVGESQPGDTTDAPMIADVPQSIEFLYADLEMEGFLLLIRLMGTVAMVIIFAIFNSRFSESLKGSAIPIAFEDCKLPVYSVSGLLSPCLYGVAKPAIYVTKEATEDRQLLAHAVAHECTHYAHKDHIWALLRVICLCIYWFNPLIWVAAYLSRRDCELACDEATIRRIGEDQRFEYGRTLVRMTALQRSPADLFSPATTMTDGARGLKERIKLIAQKPKMLAITLAAVVMIAIVLVFSTFSGKYGGDLSDKGIVAAYCGNIHLPQDLSQQLANLIDEYQWGYWPRNSNPDGEYNQPRREYRFVLSDGGEYVLRYYRVSDFSFNPKHWGEYGDRYTLVSMENGTEKRAWSLPYSFTYSNETKVLMDQFHAYIDARFVQNLYGEYAFDDALYVWPLSSFYPVKEQMPEYEIKEDAFLIRHIGQEPEIYRMPSYIEKMMDAEEYKASFDLADPPDISHFRDWYRYDVYAADGTATDYSIYMMDQEVWLAIRLPKTEKITFLYKLLRKN